MMERIREASSRAKARLAGALYLRPAPVAETVRFPVALPEDVTSANVRLSPDGRKMLVISDPVVKPVMWVHSFDTGRLERLPGAEGFIPMFAEWSPGGDAIAYSTEGKLRKVLASGGPSQVIGSLPARRNLLGDWVRTT